MTDDKTANDCDAESLNQRWAEIYRFAVQMYPFPSYGYMQPVPVYHFALRWMQALDEDKRLPNSFFDLDETPKRVFREILTVLDMGAMKLRSEVDSGSLELSDLSHSCLDLICNFGEQNIILCEKATSLDHLQGKYKYINGKVWSEAFLAVELQRIASACDFKRFSELENNGQTLRNFFAQYRVPEMWHMFTGQVNYDTEPEDTFMWIIEQDECDAGTAIRLLRATGGALPELGLQENQYFELVDKILKKAALGGFRRFKCKTDFDHTQYLKFELSLFGGWLERWLGRRQPSAPHYWRKGLKKLLKMRPEVVEFHVPQTVSNEAGVDLYGFCTDYGDTHIDVPADQLDLANAASVQFTNPSGTF